MHKRLLTEVYAGQGTVNYSVKDKETQGNNSSLSETKILYKLISRSTLMLRGWFYKKKSSN